MEKKKPSLSFILAIIAAVSVIAAAVGVVIYRLEKKRKDDEELTNYIDCAIE